MAEALDHKANLAFVISSLGHGLVALECKIKRITGNDVTVYFLSLNKVTFCPSCNLKVFGIISLNMHLMCTVLFGQMGHLWSNGSAFFEAVERDT